MSLSTLDQMILHNFPQTDVSLMFGYGSKVVKQRGHQTTSDLIDIIIAVDDPHKWHQENFKLNNQHYSFLKLLPNSISLITSIQENYGAKIYFNPYVKVGNLLIKYGVIKTGHLIEDLNCWTSLYVAGRLHKPVEFIVNTCDKNEPLRSAMRFNKESALRAAILQLPETFDSTQLFTAITNLSYNGDLRMLFGEDKNKVVNIVSGQMDRFNQLYMPIIRLNPSFKELVHWNEGKKSFSQDLNPKTVLKNLKCLPNNVRQSICRIHGREARTVETDVVLASASRSINCDKIVTMAIASIVRRSSTSQTLKGLLTAGFVKSLKYSQRKLIKSLVSRAGSFS